MVAVVLITFRIDFTIDKTNEKKRIKQSLNLRNTNEVAHSIHTNIQMIHSIYWQINVKIYVVDIPLYVYPLWKKKHLNRQRTNRPLWDIWLNENFQKRLRTVWATDSFIFISKTVNVQLFSLNSFLLSKTRLTSRFYTVDFRPFDFSHVILYNVLRIYTIQWNPQP